MLHLLSTNKTQSAKPICLLLVFSTSVVFSQNKSHLLDSVLPRHYIVVQLQAAVAAKGEAKTLTGNYRLQSKLQSLFNGGFVYQLNLDSNWSISYGFQLNIMNTNYYLHIPDADLKGFPSTGGAPQIQDIQVYFKISMPVVLSYNFSFKKNGFYSARTGIKVNYSGFSIDDGMGVTMTDSNRRQVTIFNEKIISSNNYKPWLSYLASLSKTFILKSGSLFSIDLFGELSTTSYVQTSYQITVPNQPVTQGTFNIKGSCVGISMQYFFPKKKQSFN